MRKNSLDSGLELVEKDDFLVVFVGQVMVMKTIGKKSLF